MITETFFVGKPNKVQGFQNIKIAPILMSWRFWCMEDSSPTIHVLGKIAILKSSGSSFRANITLGGISIAVKTVSDDVICLTGEPVILEIVTL